MVSIRQTTYPDSLPDFRNLGVIARVLVAVNAIALGGALFAAPDLAQAIDRAPRFGALVEPLLLACLVVLFVLSPLLARLPYWTGCAAVMALVLLVTVLLRAGVTAIVAGPPAELGRMLVLAALISAGLLGYLRLRARAYSPALAEARLLLQRRLENAVSHGVEPGTGAGEVLVHIERRGDRVLARIENPYVEEQQHRAGNRMALENIRERLALFFDAEARIETRVSDSRYRVEIEIPYRVASR